MRIGKLILLAATSFLIFTGCEKDPGEGGNSSITGYVHVTDYNASLLIIQGEYPGADEDIFIVYGNDISFGDRSRTGHDGRFEFKYLREGKYTVYVYSDDTTLSGKSVVSVPVEITKKNQTVDIDTLHIKKN